jgi:uncharacterized protein (UPF0218 family)
MKKLKDLGYDIVTRSAGSHSIVDVFAISKKHKRIRLIQAKPKKMSQKACNRLKEANDWLNEPGFIVTFEVIKSIKE